MITVVDTTQPDLVGVPANATVECSALPAVPTVTATDNCDTAVPVTFTTSTAAGVCLDTYTVTRTYGQRRLRQHPLRLPRRSPWWTPPSPCWAACPPPPPWNAARSPPPPR